MLRRRLHCDGSGGAHDVAKGFGDEMISRSLSSHDQCRIWNMVGLFWYLSRSLWNAQNERPKVKETVSGLVHPLALNQKRSLRS